ncbi:MAG: M56 family metallopeptidase [Thermoanaerobaculia bacterium]
MLANQVTAWMLTYLLHSTLLLGLAWIVSKPLGRWSVAAEETVWKLALVGALFTASLQLASGWEPAGGKWSMADADAARPAASAAVVETAPLAELPAVRPVRTARKAVPALPADLALAAPSPAAPRWEMPSVSAVALGVWALGALILLASLSGSVLRLGRRLRVRPRVVGGTMYGQFRALATEAGLGEAVRLTCSSRVPVPVALGLRRPEICVPPRALARLTEEQQQGMLAHELAHLARRDPFWLLLGQVISCVLFFQPLNWVARRRLREISEMLSDEWAVARTGRPLSLAGCLAEVAGWSVGTRALPVPGMADRPSNLSRRIRRLLEEGRSPERPARRIVLGVAMVVLVIAVAAAAPAVSAARSEEPSTPTPAAAIASPTAVALAALDTPEPPRTPEEKAAHAAALSHHDDDDDYDVDVDVDVDPADVHVDLGDLDHLADLGELPELDDLGSEIGDQVDAAMESAMASLDASLEALDSTLDGNSGVHHRDLTREEREKLERDVERINQRIQRNLQPRIEQLSRDMARKATRMTPTPEMQQTIERMRKLGEQMRPSEEEMARLHSMVEKETEKYRGDREMSQAEREKLREDVQAMTQRMRPSEEQRRQMEQLRDQLRQQSQEMRARLQAENGPELEKAQREIREQVEMEMKAVRDEVRRIQEQRREMDREDRDLKRHNEMNRAPQGEKDENGKQKPPKMVLKMDMMTGKLELVPDEPGC